MGIFDWFNNKKKHKGTYETGFTYIYYTISGLKEGISKTFYPSGELCSESNNSNGKYDGSWKIFYKNGQLSSESFWENNSKQEEKEYFKNGKIFKNRYLKNGKFVEEKYYLDGSIIPSGTEIFSDKIDEESRIFINGKLEGVGQKRENPNKKPVDTKDTIYNRTVDLDIDMDSIYRKIDEINDPRRKNDEGYLRWKKKEDLIKSVIEDESKIEINHNTIVYIENLEKESTLKDVGNDWDLDVDEVIEKFKENNVSEKN